MQQMAIAAADLLAAAIDRHETQPEQRVFSAQFIEGATARLTPALALPPDVVLHHPSMAA